MRDLFSASFAANAFAVHAGTSAPNSIFVNECGGTRETVLRKLRIV